MLRPNVASRVRFLSEHGRRHDVGLFYTAGLREKRFLTNSSRRVHRGPSDARCSDRPPPSALTCVFRRCTRALASRCPRWGHRLRVRFNEVLSRIASPASSLLCAFETYTYRPRWPVSCSHRDNGPICCYANAHFVWIRACAVPYAAFTTSCRAGVTRHTLKCLWRCIVDNAPFFSFSRVSLCRGHEKYFPTTLVIIII